MTTGLAATKIKVYTSLMHCEKCKGNTWWLDQSHYRDMVGPGEHPKCATCNPVEGAVHVNPQLTHWPWKKRGNDHLDIDRSLLPGMFPIYAVKACNYYAPKTAWALKREMREDLQLNTVAAVAKWTPFIENTLGVKV